MSKKQTLMTEYVKTRIVTDDIVVRLNQEDFVRFCGFDAQNYTCYSMERVPLGALEFTFRKVTVK